MCPEPKDKRYLNVEEAARYLRDMGVPMTTAGLQYTHRDSVPRYRFGKHVRYDTKDLDRWASEQKEPKS